MPDIVEADSPILERKSSYELRSEMSARPLSVSPFHVDRPGYYGQLALVSGPYMLVDLLASILAGCTVLLMLDQLGETTRWSQFLAIVSLSNIAWLWQAGLYPGLGLHPADELRRIVRGLFFSVQTVVIGYLVLANGSFLGALTILVLLPMLWCMIPILRGWCKSLQLRSGIFVPCLFLGNRSDTLAVYKQMTLFGKSLLRPIGRVVYDHQESSVPGSVERPTMSEADELRFERDANYKGTVTELENIARSHSVYWLMEVSRIPLSRQMNSALTSMFPQVIHVNPTCLDLHQGTVFCSGGAAGVRVQSPSSRQWNRMVKRMMDICISGFALLCLLPVFCTIALLVRFSSRGPIMFYHERLGKGGKTFRAWKFRSMVQNASVVLQEYLKEHPEQQEEWDRNHKLKNDPRITWIGRILRKTSLDELPQLWNIFIGEMSLVGPRPIVREEIPKYAETYEDYIRVTPGLTGLWQISGRNNTSYADRLSLDRYYVTNWSPWLDLHILMRTIKTVLFCEGAY